MIKKYELVYNKKIENTEKIRYSRVNKTILDTQTQKRKIQFLFKLCVRIRHRSENHMPNTPETKRKRKTIVPVMKVINIKSTCKE